MARKRHKPEEIIVDLCQVDVLIGQDRDLGGGKTIAVTEQRTFAGGWSTVAGRPTRANG